jgi:hypothetical protein
MKPERWVFWVDADTLHDAVHRALGPFAVQGAMLTGLDLEPLEDGLRLRIEAEGVNAEKAAYLGRKLDSLPFVRSVSVGWLSNGPPPSIACAA